MKLLFIALVLSAGSSVFAADTVLDRCVGWQPHYFAELIKSESNGSVTYEINLMGNITRYSSLSEAQTKFKATCDEVRAWE
jgi:hypothetical protein